MALCFDRAKVCADDVTYEDMLLSLENIPVAADLVFKDIERLVKEIDNHRREIDEKYKLIREAEDKLDALSRTQKEVVVLMARKFSHAVEAAKTHSLKYNRDAFITVAALEKELNNGK